MFHLRYYRCFSCKKEFTLSDGIICQAPVGATWPHCGNDKTVESLMKIFK